jgi:hypothetical protein
MDTAISKIWQEAVATSPTDCIIQGALTRNGQPADGVRISAELRLTYSASAHSLGATTLVPFKRYTFYASSDENGEFQFADLFKGTYEVSFRFADGTTYSQTIGVASRDRPAHVVIAK